MPSIFGGSNRCLGIDVGATSVKIVELQNEKSKASLKNYGVASIKDIAGTDIRTKNENILYSSAGAISKTIEAILNETKIKTKKSFFAIPDFSSFFTSFEVPKMKKSEVESAIHFQARQRVPLPLSEVTLDWTLTGLKEIDGNEVLEVLLLAVPNETVKTYRKVAKEVGLQVGSLDAGAFGLAKVYGKKEQVVVVCDIGDQSTTVSIIEDETPKHSHSLDIAGKDFVESFAILPEINYTEDDENSDNEVKEVSSKIKKSLAEDLSTQIRMICENYQSSEKKIDKMYLIGGGSKFQEVGKVLSDNFLVELGRPFDNLVYPEVAKDALDDLSPIFSVAVGMALEGLNSKK